MPDLDADRPGAYAYEEVTASEVRDAIFGASPTSAPGPSGITNQAVRWAWDVASAELVTLFALSARIGHHPAPYHQSVSVALQKPRKPDYTIPRAYRLIALLDCVGKVLERIQARRLSYLSSIHGLVSQAQFGGLPGRSTDDALLCFLHDVEAAKNHGKVTSSLTFDIQGYFDHINHACLLSTLVNLRVPLLIVRWVRSFLSDRSTALCLDGIRDVMAAVQTGVPQGLPVSPILTAYYSSTLTARFTEYSAALQDDPLFPEDATAPSLMIFVDDGHIYVSSDSLEANSEILEAAYAVAEAWAVSHGLRLDPEKRELQHFSTRRVDDNVSPTVSLPGPEGVGAVEVVAQPTLKWLGVLLDRRLLFREQTRSSCAKAEQALGAL